MPIDKKKQSIKTTMTYAKLAFNLSQKLGFETIGTLNVLELPERKIVSDCSAKRLNLNYDAVEISKKFYDYSNIRTSILQSVIENSPVNGFKIIDQLPIMSYQGKSVPEYLDHKKYSHISLAFS